ncbi:MAG: hypothetical protein F7B11_04395 [Caldisphaeraceae archaeon]|nr:hypothetical protein [Caldisphaeraceae archaeon]
MLTYSKYPFALSLDEYARKSLGYKVGLDELIENDKVVKIAKKRIEGAITERMSPTKNGFSTDDEVFSFYLALGIIKYSNSLLALNLFTEAEINRARNFIVNEDEESLILLARSLDIIVNKQQIRIPWIATSTGAIRYKVLKYYVDLGSFLKTAVASQKKELKLVNSFLINGRVYLDEGILKSLIEVGIGTKIKTLANKLEVSEKMKNLSGIVSRYLKAVENKIPIRKVEYNSFPPCMLSLKNEIEKGLFIGDEKLFIYIAFLISIGAEEEEISDVLEKSLGISHTLSLRITRAFLENEDIMPYRCDVMKRKGLCPKDCGARHPVLAYKRNLGAQL